MANHQEGVTSSLASVARSLHRHLVLFVSLLVIGTAASTVLLIIQPPRFDATAEVFVSVNSANNVSDLSEGNAFTQNIVRSYASVADSPIVLNRVARSLGLSTTAAQLQTKVNASSSLDTVIISIEASDQSAAVAADIANSTAEQLTVVVGELSSTSSSKSVAVKLTTIQNAVAPAVPTSPRPVLYIVSGILLGAVLGIIAVLIYDLLDKRVRSATDITLLTSHPILSAIHATPTVRERPTLVASDTHGAYAEDLRRLRTNLHYSNRGTDDGIFLVTSSAVSEGKSTTCSNLALTYAELGKRVVVVDADLRRPRVASMFGIDGAIGLVDVLVQDVKLDSAIQSWGGARGIDVLAAGHLPPNPGELLQSPAMRDVLAILESQWDVVLIDAPPILPVADSMILAESVRAVILVVALGRVKRPQVAQALEMLDRTGVQVAGIALNFVPESGPDAYGYRYTYTYGSQPLSPAQPIPQTTTDSRSSPASPPKEGADGDDSLEPRSGGTPAGV